MKRSERYADRGARETRATGRIQLRQTDAGDWAFSGHASTWDEYPVEDFLGEYLEAFEPGAFAKTIGDRNDIVLLANHEGLPFARYPGSLRLSEDDIGLASDTELNGLDPDVASLVAKMPGGPGNRNDLNRMSIAFRAIRQEWTEAGDGVPERRRIIEARLYDVSIVTSPANPYTTAGVRDADDLLRELALIPEDEFVAQVRAAGAESYGAELLARLEALTGRRDAPATMSLDIAKRRAELLTL